jgi:hypothetical protein
MQKQHFKDGMIDDDRPTCGASRAGRQAQCCREGIVSCRNSTSRMA